MCNRPLDSLSTFETAGQLGGQTSAPTRYAIRQAMHQEHQKYTIRKTAESRQARYRAGGEDEDSPDVLLAEDRKADDVDGQPKRKPPGVKRDFFGRIIKETAPSSQEGHGDGGAASKRSGAASDNGVWVSFHEGFSNAVRKPITLEELMAGFES